MREELEIFENRSDDWLAKQRKYEERVSAWDFDEGRKIKEEHHRRHEAYEQREQVRSEIRNRMRSGGPRQLTNAQARKLSLLMFGVTFLIMIILFMVTMGY